MSLAILPPGNPIIQNFLPFRPIRRRTLRFQNSLPPAGQQQTDQSYCLQLEWPTAYIIHAGHIGLRGDRSFRQYVFAIRPTDAAGALCASGRCLELAN